MASNTPVQDDPKQLEDAKHFWDSFTQISKWSIISIVVIVILLALMFVPSGS